MQTLESSQATSPATASPLRKSWRSTILQWHWISSAVCLVGMLLFALTGITLNHAAQIEAQPVITKRAGQLPAPVLAQLNATAKAQQHGLPIPVQTWVHTALGVGRAALAEHSAEWSDDEVYLPMPRPGGDAWLRIARDTGAVEYELTERGWISWLNDLHKGRHTGQAWSWFLDIFALACVIFSLTGLLLLFFHAKQRPITWPLVGLGLLIPALLALLFIH